MLIKVSQWKANTFNFTYSVASEKTNEQKRSIWETKQTKQGQLQKQEKQALAREEGCREKKEIGEGD